MCVVFLTWEVTLYITLTVSASTRKNHRIEFAECEQSILQSRPYLCSPAKVPNDLDCSVGLWTQQFRQGHHSAQTHRHSKNAPPLQRSNASKTLQRSNAPPPQHSNSPTFRRSDAPEMLHFPNAPTLHLSNAPTLPKRSNTPMLQRCSDAPETLHLSNTPTLQRSDAPTL